LSVAGLRDSDLQFKAFLIHFSVRENFFKLLSITPPSLKSFVSRFKECLKGHNEEEVKRKQVYEKPKDDLNSVKKE